MLDELLSRFFVHDRLALARLLTLVARGEQLDSIRAAVLPRNDHTCVLAITVNAGVGKSTLVGKLAEFLRGHGKTVAVLACDPQSPLTGGALLGDRARMPSRPDDPGLFIRSLATEGGRQAVAEHLDLMVRLMAQFGFDIVLLETVGAGQGDTAVRELANVVVVHKADLAGAERMEAQVHELLSLPGCRDVAVLRVSSAQSHEQGLAELWAAIVACPRHVCALGHDARLLLRRAQDALTERLQTHADAVAPLVERWKRHEVSEVKAVDELLRLLLEQPPTAAGR